MRPCRIKKQPIPIICDYVLNNVILEKERRLFFSFLFVYLSFFLLHNVVADSSFFFLFLNTGIVLNEFRE